MPVPIVPESASDSGIIMGTTSVQKGMYGENREDRVPSIPAKVGIQTPSSY